MMPHNIATAFKVWTERAKCVRWDMVGAMSQFEEGNNGTMQLLASDVWKISWWCQLYLLSPASGQSSQCNQTAALLFISLADRYFSAKRNRGVATLSTDHEKLACAHVQSPPAWIRGKQVYTRVVQLIKVLRLTSLWWERQPCFRCANAQKSSCNTHTYKNGCSLSTPCPRRTNNHFVHRHANASRPHSLNSCSSAAYLC